MVKDDNDELSVQEKMYLYTSNYSKVILMLPLLLAFILIELLIIFEYMYNNNLQSDPLSDPFLAMILLLIVIVPLFLWLVITAKKNRSDGVQTMNQYISDVYFMALGLTPHKNDKNIPEDFYKMCLSVFPELKQNNKISIKKTGEGLKFKKITMKENGTSFAITINRRALHLKREFIITYFEKTNVDYDTLNEQIKLMKKDYMFGSKNTTFSRLVFLARTFDTEILKEHKKLMKVSGAYDLDLIIVTDSGFSGLKISE
jgi:hypothetical protein